MRPCHFFRRLADGRVRGRPVSSLFRQQIRHGQECEKRIKTSLVTELYDESFCTTAGY